MIKIVKKFFEIPAKERKHYIKWLYKQWRNNKPLTYAQAR